MLEKLFAELGRLLVQAEILGAFVMPTQGMIGDVKKRINEEMSKGGANAKPNSPSVDRGGQSDSNSGNNPAKQPDGKPQKTKGV